MVTPNVPEAEVLADMTIQSIEDMREAARRILRLGPKAVVVKGGHLTGETAVDILLERGRVKAGDVVVAIVREQEAAVLDAEKLV